MDFEWDEAKRVANLAKHDLDFIDVSLVLDGEVIQGAARHQEDEARVMITGLLDSHYVTVICTYRGSTCRIISFRKARNAEKRRHQALYGG